VTSKQRARNQAENIALMAHKRALTKRIGGKWLKAARRRSRMNSMTGSVPDLSTLKENAETMDGMESSESLGGREPDQYSFLEVRQAGDDEANSALEMMSAMRPHNTAPLRDKEWRARRSSVARRDSTVGRRASSVSQHSDDSTELFNLEDGVAASSSAGGGARCVPTTASRDV
jgi:hypothetical protein